MKRAALSLALSAVALASCQQPAFAGETVFDAPAAKRIAHESPGLKTAVFDGGCFWGVEAVFSHVKGVTSAVTGYHGGSQADASYSRVSTGRTGHAEAVKVTYDPAKVRYDQLLQVFFSVVADPTLRNRQGPDVGPQYRAALVPMNAEQRAVAAAYLKQMQTSGVWERPIVAGIEPYKAFYPAEGYHQDYAFKHPDSGYIRAWDAPKVTALSRMFPQLYKARYTQG